MFYNAIMQAKFYLILNNLLTLINTPMKNTRKNNSIKSLLLGDDKFTKNDILDTLELWGVIAIVLIFVSLLS